MPTQPVLQAPLELPINNVVFFGPLLAGPNVMAIRAGAGFSKVSGICILVPPTAPPGSMVTLEIQQSNNGIFWDHTDSFPVTNGGPDVPFDIAVIARYIRVRIIVPFGVAAFGRLHGLLKVA